MICLGIESTAHTFGASVIRDKKILSNCKKSFITQKGGMIPAKVADHHVDNCDVVISEALMKAQVKMDQVDIIAYSASPGIGNTLNIGLMVAKSLAHRFHLPLVPVNHCIAHLEISRLVTPAEDPVLLYVSGANTQVIAYDEGKYRIFGETLDVGIGNFLDSFAQSMGLGFPGGPLIQELATKGKNFIELPYVVKGMDVSFSGLLTNLRQKILAGLSKEDLAFSAQETVFAMVIEVAERAMAHCGKNELVLGGGVGCNTRLQEMSHIMCKERGAICHIPENQYLVDNAAMIAWTGSIMYQAKISTTVENATIDPYERTDDVMVSWR